VHYDGARDVLDAHISENLKEDDQPPVEAPPKPSSMADVLPTKLAPVSAHLHSDIWTLEGSLHCEFCLLLSRRRHLDKQ
jgi:hypothetical protein